MDLPGGTTELVFANLPQALNERSLQVSGRGTAQALILDVSAKQTYVDFTPNARVKELEDQLKGLGKQVRGLDDRTNLLNTQQSMLDKMETALFAPPTKDVPRPDLNQFTSSLNYLTEQKAKLTTERASLDELREELSEQDQHRAEPAQRAAGRRRPGLQDRHRARFRPAGRLARCRPLLQPSPAPAGRRATTPVC